MQDLARVFWLVELIGDYPNTCRRTKRAQMKLEAGAFSGSLRGVRLVPSKWRCLVPGEHRDGAQSCPLTLTRALCRGATQYPVGA